MDRQISKGTATRQSTVSLDQVLTDLEVTPLQCPSSCPPSNTAFSSRPVLTTENRAARLQIFQLMHVKPQGSGYPYLLHPKLLSQHTECPEHVTFLRRRHPVSQSEPVLDPRVLVPLTHIRGMWQLWVGRGSATKNTPVLLRHSVQHSTSLYLAVHSSAWALHPFYTPHLMPATICDLNITSQNLLVIPTLLSMWHPSVPLWHALSPSIPTQCSSGIFLPQYLQGTHSPSVTTLAFWHHLP